MTKGTNLLVISGFWPTESNSISGIFVVQQVAALARMGVHVTVLLATNFGRKELWLSLEQVGLPQSHVDIVAITTMRLPEALSGSVWALKLNAFLAGRAFFRKIKSFVRANNNFNGCLVHGGRYATISLPRWRKALDCPVVAVIHGVDFLLKGMSSQRQLESIFKLCSAEVVTFVLVGEPLRSYASNLGVPNEKIIVVANGTDIPSISQLFKSDNKKQGPIRIVSVSNLIYLKGIDQNIHALAQVFNRRPDLDFEYSVLGDGPERSNLEELVAQLSLEKKVTFLGRRPYEETMEEVAKADIFSLPSWGEAFGIVYLEAMARKLPVIGCFENGAADFVKHERQGLLVPPRDINALSDVLERLIDDEALRVRMGEEGRRLVESYTWENNVKKIFGLLDIKTVGHF